MSASKAGLLFVNKTPSSKSLSNSKADSQGLREINQHVQRSRNLDEERQNRKRIKKSIIPPGWGSGRYLSSLPLSTPTTATITDKPGPFDEGETRRSDHINYLITQNRTRRDASSLQITTPTWASVEPFGQFRVSMNAEKHRILQYFVLKFFPAVTRLDIAAFIEFNQSTWANPAIQIIRNALSDELHVLALLTAASARMKYVEQYHFARVDLPEQLADAALSLLRRYLAQGRPVTQELLQSILYLWAIESYRRNWEAVLMHGNMIMHLCNTYFGGFQNLNPYLRRMLWVADRFQAAATATPPLVEEKWETEEMSPQQYTYAITALAGRGRDPNGAAFSQASVHFSPKFQVVVDAVMNLARVIQCHWIGLSAQSLLPDRDWAIARSYTLSDKLLSFSDDIPTAADSYRDLRVQDCVRLALIVWLAFVPASAPYAPADHQTGALTIRAAVDARPLRNRLRSLIKHFEDVPASREEDLLLFWVAGLGAVASELVENQEWFAVQFQRYARKLGVYSWDDFDEINEAYLLLDRLQPPNHTKLSWLLQRAVYAESSDEDL